MKTLVTLLLSATTVFSSLDSLLAQKMDHSEGENPELALARAIAFYDQQLSRNTILYTGKSYYNPYGNLLGHQFYGDDYWEIGRVNYHGQQYDSIYIKYDIYKDHLLVENFNSSGFLSPIILFKNQVASFDLMNEHFLHIENDSLSNLKAGYYNELFKGDFLQVLCKRRKEIVDANDAVGLERNALREEFIEKDRYYFKKNGRYYRVKNKNSVLKVLEDRKKEVKAYFKKNVFQFKMQPDIDLVRVAEFYESIQN